MVSLYDVKFDFPGWPDDVIEQWPLKFANQPEMEMDWLPPDPMDGHRWKILITHPVAWWKDVTWKLETCDCGFDKLSLDGRKTVNGMFKALIESEENGFGGDNSLARFQRQLKILVWKSCQVAIERGRQLRRPQRTTPPSGI
jgi:hypothetical protein